MPGCFRFCLALCLTAAALAQNSPETATDLKVHAGQELLRTLDASPEARSATLAAVGHDRASELLLAVAQFGMRPSAAPGDRDAMHKAYSVLIALAKARSNLFQAAVWAQMQATVYRSLDEDPGTALTYSRQALELQQQSGITATIYTQHLDVASDLLSLGKKEEAISEFLLARDTIPDRSSPVAAQIERKLIQAYLRKPDRTAANAELERFLREPGAQRFRSEALLSKADVEMDAGQIRDALETIKAAWPLGKSEQTFQWETTNLLLECVLNAINATSYDEALETARNIEASFRDLPIPVIGLAEDAIRSRRRLAGDLDSLLREDLNRIDEATQKGDVALKAEVLRRLSVTYAYMNDNDDRVTVLRQAVSLLHPNSPSDYEKSAAAYSYFFALRMLGDAYSDDENTEAAKQCYDEIINAIEQVTSAQARSMLKSIYADAVLGNARVAQDAGQLQAARDILSRAEQGEWKGAVFDRMSLFLQIARVEKLAGNRDQAIRRYQQAIDAAVAERARTWEIAIRLERAQYTAGVAVTPNLRAEVEREVEGIRSSATKIHFPEAAWRCSFVAGLAAESAADKPAAIARYRSAVAQLDEIGTGLSTPGERSSARGTASADELYQRLIDLLTDKGDKEGAWEYLERNKARAFLETLHGRRFHARNADASLAQLQTAERKIVDLQWQLAPENAQLLKASGKDPRELSAELIRLQSQFTLTRQAADLRMSRAGQELSLKPLTLTEVGSKLPAHTALIEYALSNSRITAFIVTPERALEGVWRGDLQALRQQVDSARRSLTHRTEEVTLDRVLLSLSNLVLQPALRALPADVDHLIFVPADALNYLPFQALPLSPGQAVIDRFAVSYLPNASSIAYLGNSSQAAKDVFLGALGNIVLDRMPALPGTLAEVRGIAKIETHAQVAVEHEFTHDRLRDALLNRDVVHIASHGLLNKGSPLFDSVLTAPDANGRSRISLYELTDLNLHARLIVLSACETGIGKLSSGDEIKGFTRTLLEAGANTIVASLWSVNDESTAKLMSYFYRNLKNGEATAQALRLAALEVRKRYPNPFYWAPFIVTGVR